MKWGDGTILVALNIHPGDLIIINPLCSSGSIVTTPIIFKILKNTPSFMGVWACTFPITNFIVFALIFYRISTVEEFIYI